MTMPCTDTTDATPSEVRSDPSPLISPSCLVSILHGPDAGRGYRVEDLVSRRVFIGHGPLCQVRIDDRTIARRHAALELEGGALKLSDLGTGKGTWVNGVQIDGVHLRGGERIVMGTTALRVDTDTVTRLVPASPDTRFGRVLGKSAEMRRLYPLLQRLATGVDPILIEGEIGTGKGLVAETLHHVSRRGGPFVVMDATTATTLADLEEHLERARNGTLFVDEIGELDRTLQVKLLSAIERRFDTGFIAATRRDLDREVQADRFREDLFDRLAMGHVELPPLRRRRGDIELLARSFWMTMASPGSPLPSHLLERLEAYDWPGNVRELHDAIAQRVSMSETRAPSEPPPSSPRLIDDPIDRLIADGVPLPRARQLLMLDLERRYVKHMMALYDGHVGRAARASGIGRRYFQLLRAKRAIGR
jgi:DNA-binding NtrC family response regulator